MKALDLFCCAGGASAGLARAGFTSITGYDIDEHPSYPHDFVQGNALDLTPEFIRQFDFVWASPPCLFATAYRRRKGHVRDAENLIPATRDLLIESGVPFIIENVYGAREHLREPVMLCGSSFGLDVRRHRMFEAGNGITLSAPPCDHGWQTPRFPPAGNRVNLRRTVEVGVWRIPMDVQYKAMGGCEWMSRQELSKAIPPAYSEHLGRQVIEQLRSMGGEVTTLPPPLEAA